MLNTCIFKSVIFLIHIVFIVAVVATFVTC
nr:MAG TPA: hypothetical protein [Caudoviricetes sp.]